MRFMYSCTIHGWTDETAWSVLVSQSNTQLTLLNQQWTNSRSDAGTDRSLRLLTGRYLVQGLTTRVDFLFLQQLLRSIFRRLRIGEINLFAVCRDATPNTHQITQIISLMKYRSPLSIPHSRTVFLAALFMWCKQYTCQQSSQHSCRECKLLKYMDRKLLSDQCGNVPLLIIQFVYNLCSKCLPFATWVCAYVHM